MITQQQLNEELKSAFSVFNINDMIPRVSFKFSNRMTRTLAKCTFWRGSKNCHITLSSLALKNLTTDDMLITLRHELAHAVDFYLHNTSSHGPRWQSISAKLGGDVTARQGGRVAQVIQSAIKAKKAAKGPKWEYKCSCGKTLITTTRRAGKKMRYGHFRCCGSSVFEGETQLR